MARVLLGVTGSVAAIRTPALFGALREVGHSVAVVATTAALHFFDPVELLPTEPGLKPFYRDADEWPAIGYRRGDPVVHIELRKWAEVLVVAPLDAHTLGKFALGLSDNALSCVFRAWDFARPVIFAPAMNTLMWESPVTKRHLSQILADRGDGRHDDHPWTLDDADLVFARHAPGITVIPPQSKRLACGDVGVGGMAELKTIVEIVGGMRTAADTAGGPVNLTGTPPTSAFLRGSPHQSNHFEKLKPGSSGPSPTIRNVMWFGSVQLTRPTIAGPLS